MTGNKVSRTACVSDCCDPVPSRVYDQNSVYRRRYWGVALRAVSSPTSNGSTQDGSRLAEEPGFIPQGNLPSGQNQRQYPAELFARLSAGRGQRPENRAPARPLQGAATASSDAGSVFSGS